MNTNPTVDEFEQYKVARAKAPVEANDDFEQYKVSSSQSSEQVGGKGPEKIGNPVLGAIKQLGLGALKFITSPLDLWKLVSLGESLTDIDDLEAVAAREGVPFDREKYMQTVSSLAENFPTQDLAERKIEEKTGISLTPKTESEHLARNIGELFSLTPAAVGSKGINKVTRKAAGAVTGAVAEKSLEKAGVPQPVASLVGAGTVGASAGRVLPKKLEAPQQKLRETADKFNLRQFSGLERETTPLVKPVISKRRSENLKQELSDSSSEAIGRIIEEKIPIKKLRDNGYDIESAIDATYDRTRKLAENVKKPIDLAPVIDYIDREIDTIKRSAPSLSDPDKAALRVLQKERKQLTVNSPQQKESALLDQHGKPLIPALSSKRKAAQPNALQVVDQYQNFNENLRGLYQKPELIGAEKKIENIYTGLKDHLLKAAEQSGDKRFVESFRFANRLYSEDKKLKQTEKLLETAFKDPKKIETLLRSDRKSGFLKRNLGPQAVQDLKDIGHYAKTAEERIFKVLKIPENNPAQAIKELGTAGALALHGNTALAIGYKSIPVINRVRSYLFTRDTTRKSYADFIRAAGQGSRAAIIREAKKLNASIKEEFGSFDDLIQEAEQSVKKDIPQKEKR